MPLADYGPSMATQVHDGSPIAPVTSRFQRHQEKRHAGQSSHAGERIIISFVSWFYANADCPYRKRSVVWLGRMKCRYQCIQYALHVFCPSTINALPVHLHLVLNLRVEVWHLTQLVASEDILPANLRVPSLQNVPVDVAAST